MLAIMKFLRFYELFGVWVVVWLYGLTSQITAARSERKQMQLGWFEQQVLRAFGEL